MQQNNAFKFGTMAKYHIMLWENIGRIENAVIANFLTVKSLDSLMDTVMELVIGWLVNWLLLVFWTGSS